MRILKLGLIVGLAVVGAQASAIGMQKPVQSQGVSRTDVNSVGSIAPETGDATAIYKLAMKYDLGKEVPKDLARAEVLFRHAADMGSADAMLRVGYIYGNGGRVPHDDVQAAQWYRKAADLGQNTAMFMLGVGYWAGRGVSQDYVEAYKWISLAESRSSGRDRNQAKTARVGISRVMSPAMIADAQKRAHEWQAAFEKRK